MISEGRMQGWLSRPPSTTLQPWAEAHFAAFEGVRVGAVEGKGAALVATATAGGEGATLMMVPRDLILSRETVESQARLDRRLREVLDGLGEFGRSPRGAILVFLLFQATIACPHIPEITGVQSPLTEYIKFLPEELLPTFWTSQEQELLTGTSLRPAIRAKLNSLRREFAQLQSATSHIAWCNSFWWDEVDGLLTFDDWMHVDAMYRSRALEYPGIGDCMVPGIDMANHAAGEATVALYEKDRDGNAVLILREGKALGEGHEVTITYGDEKGACEMLFSYGFLEESMDSAKTIFLDLDVPGDDPLKEPKRFVSNAAPGVRIFETAGTATSWESDFVWLVCVNEEDGLSFNALQTVDGGRELGALWKDEGLPDPSKLRDFLQKEEMWEVLQLRAVSIVQARVEEQLRVLHGVMDDGEDGPRDGSAPSMTDTGGARSIPLQQAHKLRRLERKLLEQAYGDLEDQKMKLFESDYVRRYLGVTMDEDEPEEDFS